ncbi:MAG: hypothetical protein F9K23_16610 [Bacteroidetes bacterium]|nr:MAG: hypothetical protein F9K23_16610 [Bacteroidota bacterium]
MIREGKIFFIQHNVLIGFEVNERMKIGIIKCFVVIFFFLVAISCGKVNKHITAETVDDTTESTKIVSELLDSHSEEIVQVYPDSFSNEILSMVEDTISHFINYKSFTITERKDFYPLLIKGFTINSQKFVASIIFGNDLIIHKRIGNEYKRIFYNENAGMDPYHLDIKAMDVNFDGYNDVVFTDMQGAWGNSFSTTFLYDLKLNTLKRTPQFDLRNLSLDKNRKLLRTHSYRGLCWTIDKELYKVVNDSIELVASAEYIPFDGCNTDSLWTTKVYFYENGKLKDSTVTKAENSWDVYLKALWDLSDDYNR